MVKPIKKFQIGKNGLSEGVVEQIRKTFEDKDTDVVKVEILKSCCRDHDEADEIGEELVQELGKNFTFKRVGYVLSLRRWRKERG